MVRAARQEYVAVAYENAHDRLVAWLARRYPGQCRGRVEDAVGAAFLQALERPAAFERAFDRGGDAELVSFMHLVVRRQMRQDCRKKAHRSEHPCAELPDRVQLENPESLARARELEAALTGLVEEATERWGGRHKDRFRRALHARLGSDEADTRIAADHEVPRENLCRARNWMRRELIA